MPPKRRGFAAARRAAGHSQEQLAELLDVDRTTIQRWEAGKSAPQPWFRPKLAQCLQVSLVQLEELLTEDVASAEPAALAHPHDNHGHGIAESLRLDAGAQILIPVIVDGRPVLVPLGADTEPDDTMSPLNRRSIIGYSVAAAATAALSSSEVSRAPQLPTPVPRGSWATATYEAVLNPTDAMRQATSVDAAFLDHRRLRTHVDRAMQVSLTSDYQALESTLPSLLGQAEAVMGQAGGDESAAQAVLSDLYAVIGWTLIKADTPMGAWIAAQRAVQAAERADDVLRLAAATRCLAEVHMRAGNLEEATRTAFLAAVQLESAPPDDRPVALSLRGASLLSAAAASARRDDRREAQAALRAAAGCADELGQDRCDLASVFGPTNVAIHQVAIPIELGNAQEAVRHIQAVDIEQMPTVLTERRSRFLIDVARSYAQVGDDGAAIDALIDAEKIAPDELRHHRLTRQLVPQLLARERRSSELRALAERCGLLA